MNDGMNSNRQRGFDLTEISGLATIVFLIVRDDMKIAYSVVAW